MSALSDRSNSRPRIAALHAEAPRYDDTDWPQIVALYEVLGAMSDNPIVALNHAVAVAMAEGPGAGLRLIEPLAADERLEGDHRLHAVRGHLLERCGEGDAAASSFRHAATLTTNTQQRRYLLDQARRLEGFDLADP